MSTVLAIQKKWNDAYKQGDVVTMNPLLADDYIVTVEDGNTFSKPGYIAHNGNKATAECCHNSINVSRTSAEAKV